MRKELFRTMRDEPIFATFVFAAIIFMGVMFVEFVKTIYGMNGLWKTIAFFGWPFAFYLVSCIVKYIGERFA